MPYKVLIVPTAEKDLQALPHTDRARVLAKAFSLAHNPRPPGCKKLVNSELYRIRVGRYRVLYSINDAAITVLVVSVGHRRDVYR